VGIILAMVMKGVDIQFTTIAFLILGINIGTTTTALFASLAGKRESKRTALANICMIAVGSLTLSVVIIALPVIPGWFVNTFNTPATQVAAYHMFTKIFTISLMVPFTKQLAALMYKIIPKQIHAENVRAMMYIRTDSVDNPGTALRQAQAELGRVGQMVLENLKRALAAFFTGDRETAAAVNESELSINYLNRQITGFLRNLKNVKREDEIDRLSILLYIASDLERIGDHAENITEYDIRRENHEIRLPEKAMEELNQLSEAVIEMLTLTITAFVQGNERLIGQVMRLEDKIDAMSKQFIENHIQRLKTEQVDPRGGVAFLNLVTDLERCADHANNIVHYFIGSTAWAK
jgi:phosphate:Na+ symporter